MMRIARCLICALLLGVPGYGEEPVDALPGVDCPPGWLPPIPRITAIGDASGPMIPLPQTEPVSLAKRHWRFRLDWYVEGEGVAVYLDGELISDPLFAPSASYPHGCFAVCLPERLPPGLYELTVRTAPYDLWCYPASRASEPVVIRYQPRAWQHYMWSPHDAARCAEVVGMKVISALSQCFCRVAEDLLTRLTELIAPARLDATAKPLAFGSTPAAHPLGRADEVGPGLSGPERPEEVQRDPPGSHFFLAAAHFPLRKYGLHGEPSEEEGAVIYEGMRFAGQRNGRYDVDFLVRIPAMPTTLRLQFLIQSRGAGADRQCPKTWYTVTLPPIEIRPPQDSSGKFESRVYCIHHDGYSPAIEKIGGDLGQIRREGTARFGFGTSL